MIFLNLWATVCQVYSPAPLSFWMETLCIFLGDVFAVLFLGASSFLAWYILKYPGFRVGANWSWVGWDYAKMGRFPNEMDEGNIEFVPNVSVTCHDTNVKKVICAVWVRERADVHNPGVILGHLDLRRAGIPVEARTTGGEPLNLYGPTIVHQASKFQQIINFPIFVQTSDNEFYKASSPGNSPKGMAKFRLRVQSIVHATKQRLFAKLG